MTLSFFMHSTWGNQNILFTETIDLYASFTQHELQCNLVVRACNQPILQYNILLMEEKPWM